MAIYKAMYLPVLLHCCIVTAGYVIYWVMQGGDIDLGPPNARVGEREVPLVKSNQVPRKRLPPCPNKRTDTAPTA